MGERVCVREKGGRDRERDRGGEGETERKRGGRPRGCVCEMGRERERERGLDEREGGVREMKVLALLVRASKCFKCEQPT